MKKIFLFISIIFILTGCTNNKENFNNVTNNTDISNETNIENTPKVDTYIDDNPITISLYEDTTKVTSYRTTLSNLTDIGVFNIYYTDIEKLDNSNIKNNYQKYYDTYENIDNYKNGFYISFEADGRKLEELVLDPSSQYNMNPYLYIYLYDDINQEPYTYYSHLKQEDMNENTIISSIKLFLGEEVEKITSPITLTAFTYDGDEDFEDNKYRGISSYTIEIETK